MMEVILKQDIEKLGQAGSVVKVKPGYARNYLIPKGLAIISTQQNVKVLEAEKNRKARQTEKEKAEATELAGKLESFSCTIAMKAGADDKLFGAVTSENIAEAIKAAGIDVDKKKIILEEPLKALGVYNIEIHLYPEITATIKVWVVKE
jgi:large subunit ribosomal protein L9